MTHTLLALDLSSNVGIAVMRPNGDGERRPPYFQTLRLEGIPREKVMSEFADWLESAHVVQDFDGCAWERPIITPRDKVDKLEILYGLVGITYAFVGRHSLPWREVTLQDAKHALTGKFKADKADMIAAANRLGWRVSSDHEADAGAVGLCAYRRIWPK